MIRINVDLERDSYPVIVGSGVLESLKEELELSHNNAQIAVISNERIFSLYGAGLTETLEHWHSPVNILVPDGEQAKSMGQVESIYTTLLEKKFERGAVIIALGGGVVGDLAGFVAATYLRGVGLVQVPTSLLAQVDSSIGGKVGVNHPLGKNLIGAFKQPLFVLSDVNVLDTLPPEELRCGMGEVIKYGFIRDPQLFAYLETHLNKALSGDRQVLLELVKRSAEIKADVVARDEREQNLRMILNFGHTFGHALEAELRFSGIRHGEAVILGMQCALEYSRLVHGIDSDFYERGLNLLKKVPVSFRKEDIDPSRLVERMALDKKVKQQQIRLVLVDEPGKHRIETVRDPDALLKAWNVLK